MPQRVDHGFYAVACVQLAEDLAQVVANGFRADAEPAGDLLVGEAGHDALEHLELAWRKSRLKCGTRDQGGGRERVGRDAGGIDGRVQTRYGYLGKSNHKTSLPYPCRLFVPTIV